MKLRADYGSQFLIPSRRRRLHSGPLANVFATNKLAPRDKSIFIDDDDQGDLLYAFLYSTPMFTQSSCNLHFFYEATCIFVYVKQHLDERVTGLANLGIDNF
jgi:hypothetical protein